MKIVEKFQKKLEISRGEAKGRVIGIVIVLCIAAGVIASVLTLFPYKEGFTKKVILLTDDYVEVNRDDVEVVVALGPEGRTLISLPEPGEFGDSSQSISYYIKKDGVSYHYDQLISVDMRYRLVDTTIINNGKIVMLCYERDELFVSLLPILILPLLLSVFIMLQRKRALYGGEHHRVWL